MQHISAQDEIKRDYQEGYAQVMWFAERAHERGWRLSDRQLVHEIMHAERAALIREQSSLPMIGTEVRSAAWHHGKAEALRALLREQRQQREH